MKNFNTVKNINTMMTGVNTTVTMKKKSSKGRKKIEIKKIIDESTRQVTFSKRRSGLFKKASELCILTEAQCAVLVHSPGGRVFTFGHPSADVIVDRYLNGNNTNTNNIASKSDESSSSSSSNLMSMLEEYNKHYDAVSIAIEFEKQRREIIEQSNNLKNGVAWYDESVEKMKVDDLEQYLYSLVELKQKVLGRANDLMLAKKNSSLLMNNSNTFDRDNGNGNGMGPSLGFGFFNGYN